MSDDRTKALAEAKKTLAAEEKALSELQEASSKRGAVVAALRKEATGDLTEAPLSDLMSQAGDIAVSQFRLTSAESVLGEIERRIQDRQPPVAEARKKIGILEAPGLEVEAMALEDKILAKYQEISTLGARVVKLEGEIATRLGTTRPSGFTRTILEGYSETAASQHKNRQPLRNFGYKV